MATHAVLLDIDGTLVDSNDAHAKAWVDVLAERGRRVEFSRVRPLIGMGSDKLLPQIGIDAESAEGRQLSARHTQVFLERYLPSVKPFPCAHELLQRLVDDGLCLVLATSAKEKEMKELIRLLDAERLIHAAANASEAEESKPDPDIVRQALRKSGARAENAIMLGDTPYDIEAALRTSVRVVALRCGGWAHDQLSGATAVFDDPRDVLNHYAESPFAGLGRASRAAANSESAKTFA